MTAEEKKEVFKWERKMTIEKDYIVVPVKNGAPKVKYTMGTPDAWKIQFDVELGTTDNHDFIAFNSVTDHRGSTLDVIAESENADAAPFGAISFSDEPVGLEGLYEESGRPLCHFTPRRGWTNDPNGMVYYKGQYHLFFQHNPFGWSWGNMHWGHATSPDMIHWTEHNDAVLIDPLGTAFSGSGVVDWNNTSGLQQGEDAPIVLLYTACGGCVAPPLPSTQCITFSTDAGKTWKKYEGNPVVPHIAGGNRDPKVIRHQATGKWVMALFLDGDYAILTSDNLTEWTEVDRVTVEGATECPDIFELPVDGDASNTKWVFWGASGCHLVGSFDGLKFTAEAKPRQFYCNGGARAGGYAAQTFSDVPAEDGRRIQMAWLQGALDGMPFNQQMTVPVVLTLKTTPDGILMCGEFVKELQSAHGKRLSIDSGDLDSANEMLAGLSGEAFRLKGSFAVDGESVFVLTVGGTELVVDCKAGELKCRDKAALLPDLGGKVDLDVVIDRASIEIISAGGQVYVPLHRPLGDGSALSLAVRSGRPVVESLDVWEIETTWRQR